MPRAPRKFFEKHGRSDHYSYQRGPSLSANLGVALRVMSGHPPFAFDNPD
ncbi:MAG TPA: hypothetical protein VLJ11_21055 [Bryobacteraceae bacterium]|nr:hypothetical protein [Bryobacteraceae bacterium]